MKQELTTAELEARFTQINTRPPEQLTEEEARSLAEAEAMDDGTTVTLEELWRELLLADATRILSEFAEDYRRMADSDTQYLSSIPGMVDSIKAAAQEPAEECIPYDPSEKW